MGFSLISPAEPNLAPPACPAFLPSKQVLKDCFVHWVAENFGRLASLKAEDDEARKEKMGGR